MYIVQEHTVSSFVSYNLDTMEGFTETKNVCFSTAPKAFMFFTVKTRLIPPQGEFYIEPCLLVYAQK